MRDPRAQQRAGETGEARLRSRRQALTHNPAQYRRFGQNVHYKKSRV
jgi:hypothetical protein